MIRKPLFYIILCALLTSCATTSFNFPAKGQGKPIRVFSDSNQNALGYYVKVLRTFGIPSLPDTSLSGGFDSLGNLIYVKTTGKQGLWYRDTVTGAHKWSPIQISSYAANAALMTDANGKISASPTVSSTELGFLNGVTSSVQTQITAKRGTALASGLIWVGNGSGTSAAVAMSGDATLTNAGVLSLKTVGSAGSCAACILDIDVNGRVTGYSTGAGGGGISVVTGTTPISVANGATTPDISIGNAAADGSTKGAATFTATDFNAASGVISIDYAAGQAAGTGTKGFLSSTDWNTFNGKEDLIDGGASTIAHTNLTVSRVLISSASGKVAVSTVASATLAFLSGTTSNVQTQLNNRLTTTLASANILVGSSLNVATARAMSGDASISNIGVLTLDSLLPSGTCSDCILTFDKKGRILTAADGSGGGGSSGTVTNVTGTSPITITSTPTTTPNVTIANSAADGSTKGAAAFNANDFNAASGIVSFDYTNAQKATTLLNGILTSTDWTTFNNKVSTSRTITAGTGLTGGGDLSANRTITLNSINGFIAAGTNVTITGTGTIASPYTIAASGGGGGGSGTVTSVSVVTANGVSGTVATATTTPAITLTVQNAAADGATKGIATFKATDFTATTGIIRLDYANAHVADADSAGFTSPTQFAFWNGKQDSIHGAIQTVTQNNLTATRVVISNGAGKLIASRIDTTHLGFLGNVTADIQAQLDALAGSGGGTVAPKAFQALGLNGSNQIAWNYLNGYNASYAITANREIVITNDANGDYGTLVLTQNGSGGNLTVPTGDLLDDGIGSGRTITLTPHTVGTVHVVSYVKRQVSVGVFVRYWTKGWYY